MKKITKDNYHLSSTGIFKEVKVIKENILLNREKFIEEIEKEYNVKLQFESVASFYFLNKQEKTLYRLSDHWGRAIRSCNWFLNNDDYRNNKYCETDDYFTLAKITFNKLTKQTFNNKVECELSSLKWLLEGYKFKKVHLKHNPRFNKFDYVNETNLINWKRNINYLNLLKDNFKIKKSFLNEIEKFNNFDFKNYQEKSLKIVKEKRKNYKESKKRS